MSEEAHLQARHYRRGTILGLTLAELLMLLLFLFLLIMAFVINEREERIEQLDEERRAWRENVPLATGIVIPQPISTVLQPADLDRPIEDLRAIREERDQLQQAVNEIAVEDLQDLIELKEALEELAHDVGVESPSHVVETITSLVQRASSIRPGQRPGITLEEGLEGLGSGLEPCIWMPFEEGATTRRVAFSYVVTLLTDGIRVSEGDPEAFNQAWTGDLPRIPSGSIISIDEFNQATQRFKDVGNSGAPVAGTDTPRRCRFYVRLQRSRRLTDIDLYDNMIQGVTQNFFRGYRIEIVD
ncbi:hypothetical protein NHF40_01170 [Maricaulaceae bacterium EIL42A08]|nr:hypothetical protein [Maricaulaceae bacterium EIL42A08]